MFFRRSKGKDQRAGKSHGEAEATERARQKKGKDDHEIGKALVYMYVIIGSQVLLLFIVIIALMIIGKVITTPWWIFALILAAGTGGCVFAYYRFKQSLRNMKKMANEINLGDRNYEISVLGGALSIRVEQNRGSLLEAPSRHRDVERLAIEAPGSHANEASYKDYSEKF
ncbi:MAG: hypothetical protein PHU03_06485 [Syntrophales bacterium]|nr:hypothetical protein [Syntrophales bacterium]